MCDGPHDYIPVEATVKVEMIYTTPGGSAENTLYFKHPDGWSAEEAALLAADIAGWQDTSLAPLQSNQVALRLIKVTDLESETGFAIDVAVTPTQAGELTSPILPGNVTGAIKFGTNARGRSYRGRNFVLGLTEAEVVGDTIDLTVATAYEIAYGVLLDAIDRSGTQHVVVSLCHDGVWRTTGVATVITSYSMEQTVDSQRRRLAGRGI